MPNEQKKNQELLTAWTQLKEQILTLPKPKNKLSQLQTQIQNKRLRISEQRRAMSDLLREDSKDEKVWLGSPEELINDSELEERGKRLDELEIEISTAEQELAELESELKQLEITPLTVELERKLELLKSLIQEQQWQVLKDMVREGRV